jgi:hypothetical protein
VTVHSDQQCVKTSYRSFDLEETLEMDLLRWGCEVLTRPFAFFLADG